MNSLQMPICFFVNRIGRRILPRMPEGSKWDIVGLRFPGKQPLQR